MADNLKNRLLERLAKWNWKKISRYVKRFGAGLGTALTLYKVIKELNEQAKPLLVAYDLAGWEQYIFLGTVLLIFFVAMLFYYCKIRRPLGISFQMEGEQKKHTNPLPTYAMGARMVAWVIMVIFAFNHEKMQTLAILYTVYLCAILVWSTFPYYHREGSRMARSASDVLLASVITYQHGGVLGPAALMFLIPLSSLVRNFTRGVAKFWTWLTLGIIATLAYRQSELFQKIEPSQLTQLFVGSGTEMRPEMVPIYQLNHLATIVVIVFLVYIIIKVERRITFQPLLRDLARAMERRGFTLFSYMEQIAQNLGCEMIILTHGSRIYLAFHSVAKQIIPEDSDFTGAPKEVEESTLAATIKNCAIGMKGQIREDSSFDVQISGHFKDLRDALAQGGILPAAVKARPIYSAEFCLLPNGDCLLALNRYTRNRVTYQNFPSHARDTLRIYAQRIESLVAVEERG